jgi:hypothetical protein
MMLFPHHVPLRNTSGIGIPSFLSSRHKMFKTSRHRHTLLQCPKIKMQPGSDFLDEKPVQPRQPVAPLPFLNPNFVPDNIPDFSAIAQVSVKEFARTTYGYTITRLLVSRNPTKLGPCLVSGSLQFANRSLRRV